MTTTDALGRDRALERALTRLVCDAALDNPSPGQFLTLLDEEGVRPEDRDALLVQGVEGWLRYRRLLAGTLRNAVAMVAPLTAAHLGARLDDDLRSYLAQRALESRYLRGFVDDFVRVSLRSWEEAPALPDFVPDLARYETARAAVAAAPNAIPTTRNVGLDLALGVCFIEACRLGSYRYRVNEVSLVATEGFRTTDGSAPERPDPVPAPDPGETLLLLYRDVKSQVQCLRLSPFAYAVLEGLLAGETLAEAVKYASRKLSQPVTAPVIEGTAKLLGDLATLGILLGPAIS